MKHIIFPRQFYTDAGLQEKLLTLLRYIITQPFSILGDLNVDQSFNRSTKGRRLVRMEHQRYELFLTPPPPLAKILNSFFSSKFTRIFGMELSDLCKGSPSEKASPSI